MGLFHIYEIAQLLECLKQFLSSLPTLFNGVDGIEKIVHIVPEDDVSAILIAFKQVHTKGFIKQCG